MAEARTLALACLLFGCTREAPVAPLASDQPSPAFATSESLRVQRGMRDMDVHCALECGNAQVELSRLQRDCVRDPQSTVHHVTDRAPMIALGCCTEAASVFSEACGDEGLLGACIRRWASHCERGELLEHEGEGS